jgi:ribosomal protein L9
MNNTYKEKYLKYKSKYMILKNNGGAWKAKSEERKAKQSKEKADAEYIKKVLEAWEKITQTELFRADVEMLSIIGNTSVEEAIEMTKNKIISEEETKQKYYMINSIKEAMDFLELKPITEVSGNINNDIGVDDFF